MVALARDFAQAKGFIEPPGYRRHRPESTLLYRLVAEHYPTFRDRRAAEERPLPRYVEDEFEAYLRCGRLEHGFLRVKCESCQAEKLVAFSCCLQPETISSFRPGEDGGHQNRGLG
jgi:hypothetical protein